MKIYKNSEKGMKKIGSVVGDLYHKHYVDDAFQRYKRTKGVKEALIVTYCGYLDIGKAFDFLKFHVFPNSETHRVIIGLGGIGNGRGLKESEFQSVLSDLIQQIPYNVELYLHAACHVKMLSYDSFTIIGSQNLSSTSLSLSANPYAKYKFHEAQIEFKDPKQLHAKALIEEILCDSSMYARITRQSKATIIADSIIRGAKAEGVKQKIQLVKTLSGLLEKRVPIPARLNLEPSIENNVYFVKALIKFYNSTGTDLYGADELYQVLYPGNDDYPAGEELSRYVYDLSQLLELIDEVAFPQKQSVLNIFQAVYSSKLGFAEESDFQSFSDDLKSTIELHYATSMQVFIDKHQHNLVQRIIENPDCTSIIESCRNDEGMLDEYCIHQSLLEGDINVNGYLDELNLSEYIEDVNKLFQKYYMSGLQRAFDAIHSAYDDYSQAYKRHMLAME